MTFCCIYKKQAAGERRIEEESKLYLSDSTKNIYYTETPEVYREQSRDDGFRWQ
jgi:hypothetical protein